MSYPKGEGFLLPKNIGGYECQRCKCIVDDEIQFILSEYGKMTRNRIVRKDGDPCSMCGCSDVVWKTLTEIFEDQVKPDVVV